MHSHEGALVLPFEGDAGGAVRLVADDEVERQFLAYGALCLGYAADALIGAEHHQHALTWVVLQHEELLLDLLHAGRGRKGEIFDGGKVGILVWVVDTAHFAIGADAHRAQGLLCVEAPLAQRLPQQGDARHEEKHGAHLERFGYAEAGVGLARAAGHDELAAVVVLKVGFGFVDGQCLMFEGLLVRCDGLLPGESTVKGFPIYGQLREFGQMQNLGLDGLASEALGSGGGEAVVGGVDPQTEVEMMLRSLVVDERARRGGEESVHIRLVYLGVGTVAFTLHRPVATADGAAHEVDARVEERDAGAVRKVGPQPHLLQLVAVGWYGAEHGLHQAFEATPLVGFGMRLVAVAIDYFSELAHCGRYLLCGRVPTGHDVCQKKARDKDSCLSRSYRLWNAYHPKISNAQSPRSAYR